MKAPEEQKKEETKKEKQNALAPSQLAPYAGDFFSPELGVIYQLKTSDGKLTIAGIFDRGGVPKLNTFSHGVFQFSGPDELSLSGQDLLLHFIKDAAGNVNGFVLDDGRTKGLHFERLAAKQNL